MQTIGLIGGLSWHSTARYYELINRRVQERRGGHSSAPLVLQSLDFARVRELQVRDDWAAAGRVLADAARRCESGGADLVLICSNLMHRVADQVQAAVDVPLLHIADAVAARAAEHGWTRLGLLGARGTMEGDFVAGRLGRAGATVLVPGAEERLMIDRVVFDELTRGLVRADSRAAFVRVIDELAGRGAEAVVLGCTEIELLIGPDDTDLPLVDSMRAHAEAAVDAALAPAPAPAVALPATNGTLVR